MEAVQVLSIWVDIPLGPEADFVFSDRTIEATSSLEQEMVDKPSLPLGSLFAAAWGVEKQEVKNELRRLASAGVLSAVTELRVRRCGTRLLEDRVR